MRRLSATAGRAAASAIASSSSTRCAQVWRARIVSRPLRDQRRREARDRAAAACSARGHLRAVARHQVVLARPEQMLASFHGARDQRDAAGQRLEHADGRDARQQLRHRSAAAHARSRDGGRRPRAPRHWRASHGSERRSPRSCAPRRVGIAHAVDVERQARSRAGRSRKSSSSCAALVVAPVADPDQALARSLSSPADGTAACRPPRARRTRGRAQPQRS